MPNLAGGLAGAAIAIACHHVAKRGRPCSALERAVAGGVGYATGTVLTELAKRQIHR